MAVPPAPGRAALDLLIQARAAQHPDQVWLRCRGRAFTWAEVLSSARRAANGLRSLGLQPGDRVALMLDNRPEFLWLFLGATLIGVAPVPVNTAQRGAALNHILGDSGAVALAGEASLAEVVTRARTEVPALRLGILDGPGLAGQPSLGDLLAHPDHDPAVEILAGPESSPVMYTSGTTGPPKGVITVKADGAPRAALLAASGVKPGETMYTCLPLFHGNALFVSALGSMALDARLALGERFSASRLWAECQESEAVVFNTVGGMIPILLKQPPGPDDRRHPVRVVLSSGCPAEAWRPFEERFGVRIVEWYGIVDAAGNLLNDAGRVGALGRPVAGVEFRVVDADDRPLPPGQVGELVFRHPDGVLRHYLNQPELTREAHRGGWFHSGDLARQDEGGFFYYRGRLKESMRRRGENVSAWEVETVVNAHPEVEESAAYGVPSPLGEDDIMVAVVRRPASALQPAALLDHCQGQLAAYALPRYVDFLPALPKTPTLRIRYLDLKQRGVTPATWDRARPDGAPGPGGRP